MGYQYRGAQRGGDDPWQAPPKPPTPPTRKPVQPCGTYAAAIRHYRNGEPPCDPCKEARLAYERSREAGAPKKTWKHGTYSGAIGHRRNGEKPCDPCRLAANQYRRERRAQTKKEAA
jgi:hypothetical protein